MKESITKVPTVDLSSLAKQSMQNSNKGLPGFGRGILTNPPANQHKGQCPNNPAYTDVVVKAMKGK